MWPRYVIFLMKRILVLVLAFVLGCSLHFEHALAPEHLEDLLLHLAFSDPNPAINYEQTRDQYLSNIVHDDPPNPNRVNIGQAYDLANFFGTTNGRATLSYFDQRSKNPQNPNGLNFYQLSDKNFRLWMAIKILSGPSNEVYARSLASDRGLFVQLINISNYQRQQRQQQQ